MNFRDSVFFIKVEVQLYNGDDSKKGADKQESVADENNQTGLASSNMVFQMKVYNTFAKPTL